jgi:hypothetical protein
LAKQRVLEFKGERRTVNEWAEYLDINPRTIHGRLRRGWSIDRVLIPTTKLLRNVAYGPSGFTCECGCAEFIFEPKRLTYAGNVLTRPEHRCTGCDKNYLFVPYSAANGTTV